MTAFTIIGSGLLVLGGLAVQVRDTIRYRQWVNGPRLAPTEPMPTAYEQEWLDHRHARDEAPNVVEDFELLDAYITDRECEALDEWFGYPVLPETPENVRKLAAL